MVIWPEASNAQKSIAAVSRRQNGLRLDPPLELFAQAFDGIRASNRFPLALRETREGEKPVARFFQAVGDRTVFQPPLNANRAKSP
jgi:hypothetical protein